MKAPICYSTLIITFLSGIAFAGHGWQNATAEFRKAGIEFVVCNNVSDQILCLGLSCRGGGYDLISIRSGSGPLTGKAKISTASNSFVLVFSEEFQTIGGVALTRAKIDREGVNAIMSSRQISIRETNSDSDMDSFSGANLSKLIKTSKSACPALD